MSAVLKKTIWLGILLLGANGASAMTAGALHALQDQGEPIALVDVREASLFQAGHIPNAINVPIWVLERKKLPPLGRVVVYGRGLGSEDMLKAVELLNAKPGIHAEILEGGYAAWKRLGGQTTQPAGLQEEVLEVVSYQGLQDVCKNEKNMVLVDLRAKPSGTLSRQGEEEPQPTSLAEKFPGSKVVSSPFDVAGVPGSGKLARQSDAPLPLMVLIDDGDGKAQEMARILKENGITRVVILAGGERILERDGAAGLQRMGMGSNELESNHADE